MSIVHVVWVQSRYSMSTITTAKHTRHSFMYNNCSRIYIKFWDLYTCKMHPCHDSTSSLFSFINSSKLSQITLSVLEQLVTLWVAIFIWNNRILYCKLPLHPMQWVGQPKHRKLPSFHIHVIYSIYGERLLSCHNLYCTWPHDGYLSVGIWTSPSHVFMSCIYYPSSRV